MACANCQSVTKLLRCTGCFQVGYCNQQCQKTHWKQHKAQCVEFKAKAGEHKQKLLSHFELTQKDLMTRLIYEQIKSRIRPKTGPIPATINFIMIFMIGESVDKIREQILKIYEIPLDIFINCVKDDLQRQNKAELLNAPEKIPLVLVEYFQERIIAEGQSEFHHGAGLTLYPFEDGPLVNKFGLASLTPLQTSLNLAADEQGRSWTNPVDFVLPFERTDRTKYYLQILDQLKTVPYDDKAVIKF